MESSKLRKINTEQAGPEEPPTRLPLRDSIGYPESNNPRSSPESGTKLMWKYSSSSEGAQRRVHDTSSQDAVRGLDCSFYWGGEGEASAGLDRSNSLWTRQFVGNNWQARKWLVLYHTSISAYSMTNNVLLAPGPQVFLSNVVLCTPKTKCPTSNRREWQCRGRKKIKYFITVETGG